MGIEEMRPPRVGRAGRLALRLAGGYVLVALAWIVLSDKLLDDWLAAGALGMSPVYLQIAKGSGFVLVTGGLLYLLIRRYLAAAEDQAERAREALADLELAVDGSDAAVWRVDVDPETGESRDAIELSPRAKAIIGFEPDAFPDSLRAWKERVPAEDLQAVGHALRVHLDGGSERYRTEYRIRHRDGTLRWILSTGRTRRDARGRPLRWVGFDWDVTRHRETRRRVEKLSRLYATLSHTNQAIVHITEPEALFARVTRIAIEEGGLSGCWIGLLEAGSGQPCTVAVDGPAREFMDRVHGIAEDAMPRTDEDMVAAVLRSGQHQVINDYDEDDPRIRHCWYAAQQACVRASAAFPVRRRGIVAGVMALYASEAGFFDADLLELLDEMAADLSFALDNHAREQERQRIEARLRATTEYFETLIAAAPVAIVALSAEGRVRLWNPAAEATFGWTRDEVLDRLLPIVPADKQDEFAVLRHSIMAGSSLTGKTLRRRRKDGSEIEISVYVAPLRNEHGQVDGIMAIMVDMTERNRIEQALREGEARYRQLFEAYPAPLWVFDRETLRFLTVNRAAVEHYGYDREAFLSMTIADLQPPEEGAAPRERIDYEAGRQSGLQQHVRRDGSLIDVAVIAHPLTFMNRPAVVVMAQDVTERLRAERERQLAATVFENSREAIVITDARQRIISINQAFTDITGYTLEEVRGNNPSMLASGRHDARFYEQLWKTLETDGYWQGEIWNRRKNGEVYPEWLGISVVRDQHAVPTHYVGIFMDISKRKEAEQRIDFLAYYDALSGLPNRTLLIDRLRQSIAHAQRTSTLFAVLFLDLDRFKTINESLGHTIGDRLLKIVAERLQGLVREGDTVSRQGGDEFTILLTDLQRNEQIGRMAEEILTRLAEPMYIDDHSLTVTASIGISVFPHNGRDVETLLKNADAAVFHAKGDGRNSFRFFTSDMTEISRRRLDLENRLHRAIAREDFELYYQPEVEAGSGIIRGVEVLIRWHEPELGWVSPGDFIPIAEDAGLIVPLGEWILRQACREAHRWQADCSVPMPIAVNISAIQFHRPDFAELVETALRDSGLRPELLELELTERILMGDRNKSALSTMDRLHRLGVRLAIDDFGTGYSSLSYLRRFKVDKLKVDQSFVSEMSDSADAEAIVKSIIDLAHNLQIAAVAEGVETPEQVEYLQRFGCELMQGYLLCRPLPRDELMAFLRQGYIRRERFMGLA